MDRLSAEGNLNHCTPLPAPFNSLSTGSYEAGTVFADRLSESRQSVPTRVSPADAPT